MNWALDGRSAWRIPKERGGNRRAITRHPGPRVFCQAATHGRSRPYSGRTLTLSPGHRCDVYAGVAAPERGAERHGRDRRRNGITPRALATLASSPVAWQFAETTNEQLLSLPAAFTPGCPAPSRLSGGLPPLHRPLYGWRLHRALRGRLPNRRKLLLRSTNRFARRLGSGSTGCFPGRACRRFPRLLRCWPALRWGGRCECLLEFLFGSFPRTALCG